MGLVKELNLTVDYVFDVHVLLGYFFDGNDISGVDIDSFVDSAVSAGTDV